MKEKMFERKNTNNNKEWIVKYEMNRHYFLAQGGVDTQVLIKELGTIHLGPSTEHRQPILDTDIEVRCDDGIRKYTDFIKGLP